jgi:hypothetical protein
VSKWTKEEDGKLQDAVEKRKGEDWVSISELVPGRSKQQSSARWHDILAFKSDETTAHVGNWTTDEHAMLTDAVKNTMAKIGLLFLSRFRVERKHSVRVDGTVPCTPRAKRRSHARVNRQRKKTAS